LKKIHKYGCCLARATAAVGAVSYCLSLMEISSINFVSESLVFSERRTTPISLSFRHFCTVRNSNPAEYRKTEGCFIEGVELSVNTTEICVEHIKTHTVSSCVITWEERKNGAI
jgi:hypothetical protein